MPRLNRTIPSSASLNWSPEQEAIFAAGDQLAPGDNLLVNAVAGSGKTTVEMELASRSANFDVLYLAFMKSNQTEAEARMRHGVAKTFDGMGYGCIFRAFPALSREVLHDRTRGLVRKLRNWGEDWKLREAVERLAFVARRTQATTPEELMEVADVFDVETSGHDQQVAELTAQVLELAADPDSFANGIDHPDMSWLPWRLQLPVPNYQRVLVDEAQDLNGLQHWLTVKASDNGSVVIVGDRNQAIYHWRGAYANSMDELAKCVTRNQTPVLELPLSYTRRCPKSHVALAQKLVPQIKALEDAPEGKLREECWVSDIVRYAQPQDFVLSRLNAPLCDIARRLWKAGKPALIRGKDVEKGIKTIVEKAAIGASTLRELLVNARNQVTEELGALLLLPDNKGEARATALNDRLECIESIAVDARDISELRRRISTLFSEGSGTKPVILSTIHKAKGLEANNVWLLTRKLPHPSAVTKESHQQELNLLYVALTRCKGDGTLALVGDTPACLGA